MLIRQVSRAKAGAKVIRAMVLAIGFLLPVVSLQLVGAPAALAAQAGPAPLVRTLYYDTSQAAEFAADWEAGAQVWNTTVKNVRLAKVPAGGRANIRILADNGWPRAQVTSLGNGTVWMGREAVHDGYFKVRITAHELGHILGLPDRRTGLCSDLMSGSSAPVSCQNTKPSAAEAAAVERSFAGSAVAAVAAEQAPAEHAAAAPAAGFAECYVF